VLYHGGIVTLPPDILEVRVRVRVRVRARVS
jgi:hypothetical protein